jgi:hypothetical protein
MSAGDPNAVFYVRAWIVTTHSLRHWRTSSLPTSSFGASSALILIDENEKKRSKIPFL